MPGKHSGGMGASENVVGPTEETLLALLELLVEPLLPSKSSSRETPSPSQEESVAKQVQAVVLLYNYYHRKKHLELQFLDFDSFCKLAGIFKPSLLSYMKLMRRGGYTELNDVDKQLSLMEKKVMEACDISKSLSTSEDVSAVGWPVNKVAVFLVDNLKENCFLLHSADTLGVWSLIEKEYRVLSLHSEVTAEEKLGSKKKRITKKPLKENRSVDEISLHQQALAAVKVACGFSPSDLKLLETHNVCSMSKEKTAARFYIMQSTQSKQEANYVPIRDVIPSLQGPLVKKESGSWTTTSVVEYFHLLPYADILSDWFYRQTSFEVLHEGHGVDDRNAGAPTEIICKKQKTEEPLARSCGTVASAALSHEAALKEKNHSQEKASCVAQCVETRKEIQNCKKGTFTSSLQQVDEVFEAENQANESQPNASEPIKSVLQLEDCQEACMTEEPCETLVYKKRNRHQRKCIFSENCGCQPGEVSAECSRLEKGEVALWGLANNMDVDEPVATSPCLLGGKTGISSGVDYNSDETKMIGSAECDKPAATSNVIAKVALSCQNSMDDRALIPFTTCTKNSDKIHEIICSKDEILSQTALRVLHKKRDKLSYQLRKIEDEIALCDQNIQKILNDDEDSLAVKLDTVVESWNDVNVRTPSALGYQLYQDLQGHEFLQCFKRKRLSEADMSVRNPLEELDVICYKNNWTLPTYHVSTSQGGFRAKVTVKGMDFESSTAGSVCDTPHGARDSAASSILTKLRGMVASS